MAESIYFSAIILLVAEISDIGYSGGMNWKLIITELQASGLTQAQIADKCGCSQAAVSSILGGQIVEPKYAIGMALVALHRRATRKPRKEAVA